MARKTNLDTIADRIAALEAQRDRALVEQDPRLSSVREKIDELRKDRNAAKVAISKTEDRIASHEAWIREIQASDAYNRLLESHADGLIDRLSNVDPEGDVEEQMIEILAADESGILEAWEIYQRAHSYRKGLTASKKNATS